MKIIKQIIFVAVYFSFGILAACWSDQTTNRVRTTSSPTSSPTTSSSSAPTTSVNQSQNNNSGDSNNKVTNSPTPPSKSGGFQGNVPSNFQIPTDEVGKIILKDYGAMFVAKGVTPPSVVVFKNDGEVSSFQSGVQKSSEKIGKYTIELQAAAMNALKEAIAEAKGKNLSINPNSDEAAKRSYQKVLELWASRVNPGLIYWVGKGKIKQSDVQRIKALSPVEQITEIFKLEAQGIYFSQDRTKSIKFSVAPAGTSQHLSMLALDVAENGNAAVREVLARHGWFQTVVSDLPHFTYLGAQESELSNLGLKKVSDGGRTYWIPNI